MPLPRIAVTLFLLALAAPEGTSAQATALPTFYAPTRAFGTSEFGVTLSRPGGSGTGIEARFGAALDRADLQLRGGYVDPGASEGDWVVGVEARIPVLGRTSTFPLDGGLILGVGRSFASGGGQTIVPAGLSLGRRLALDGPALQLTPYVQPTVIFAGDALFAFGFVALRAGRRVPGVERVDA